MGKHVVIGITGGIAAYKTMYLIRLFKKNGYEVRVTATRNALQFVTPLTIETLSQNRLYTDMFDPNRTMEVEHIALADWADALGPTSPSTPYASSASSRTASPTTHSPPSSSPSRNPCSSHPP